MIWLNRIYFDDNLNNKEYKPNFQDSDSDDEGNNDANLSANSQAQPTLGTPMTTTRSGRQVRPPKLLMHKQTVAKITAVGAGIGGGFVHTNELRPMKYDEAMRKDPVGWTKSVDGKHQRMVDHKVFKTVKKKDVPPDAKILTST